MSSFVLLVEGCRSSSRGLEWMLSGGPVGGAELPSAPALGRSRQLRAALDLPGWPRRGGLWQILQTGTGSRQASWGKQPWEPQLWEPRWLLGIKRRGKTEGSTLASSSTPLSLSFYLRSASVDPAPLLFGILLWLPRVSDLSLSSRRVNL